MLLKDFLPRSCLKVDAHEITKPYRPVFDSHTHWGEMLFDSNYPDLYDTVAAIESMKSYGIMGCVNLCGFWGDKLKRMFDKIGNHRDYIHTFGSLDVSLLDEPNWETLAYQTIRESVSAGVEGMKFWKNISLTLKDKSGAFIRVDDPRLQVIWQTCAEFSIPVLIHIADPVAFFEPIDCYNERWEELMNNPDWSFCAPGLFKFHELMEQQDNLMASNRNTLFIVPHFGSYVENLAWVGSQLDKHPNMYIDVAARIAELGRQPFTARKFFLKYSNRILYGSDFSPVSHDEYPIAYRFFETSDEYFPYSYAPNGGGSGRWRIYGIDLPPDILDQLYYENAAKILGLKSEGM